MYEVHTYTRGTYIQTEYFVHTCMHDATNQNLPSPAAPLFETGTKSLNDNGWLILVYP